MSASQDQPEQNSKSTYPLDAESSVEMARLMRQDQLLTSGMGGIFPEKIDLTNVHRVLDLACGPGGWPLEVAYSYSDMEIVGVDISERMIAYARSQAEAQQRDNVTFRLMNILHPLDFPDASFDLINARLLVGFMSPAMWPTLLKECLRLLRPGGLLRFTELEWGQSNKPAYQRSFDLITLAWSRAGHTYSPGGWHIGLISVLPRMFRDAGLQNVRKLPHAIEFSADTEIRDSFYFNISSILSEIGHLVDIFQALSLAEWRDLYPKALAEMYDEDFCAMWMLMTVWGNKPG